MKLPSVASALIRNSSFRHGAHVRQFIALVGLLIGGTQAALAAPDLTQSILTSVFPAGGQQGTTVTVRFTGTNGGLVGASSIVIDGPPGIVVSDVRAVGKDQIEATLTIAEDVQSGRRMLRVKGGVNGLTNFRWFFVGPLPEHVEQSKNYSPSQAEEVDQPVVVNGRVDPLLDQDCFRFTAKKGENLVVAVLSHWMDALGYGRANAGFSDTSLELLDVSGRVLAESGDVLGYDPLIEYTIPADGEYIARVSGMGYKGHPEMVYRLTIGEVPYPTSVFPPGGRRGEQVEVQLAGPNVPGDHRQTIVIDDDGFPVQYVSMTGPYAGVVQLPVIRGDLKEHIAESSTAESPALSELALPSCLNGRIDVPGADDWFQVALQKGDSITLDIMAQRHLRSPVDMLVEVFDADRKLLASNDDGVLYQGECTHDFVPFDSFLSFTAKQSGRYLIRVSEQSGASGPRCVYRLRATRSEPDFRIFQWPDAVPVWGPGTTAGFVVETHRLGGLKGDIEVFVDGLPAGWQSSVSTAQLSQYRDPRGAFGHKVFLTVTAPDDARPGDIAEFQVVGRSMQRGRDIERTAQALTHYSWGEPHRFRYSPVSRAVIAGPGELSLSAATHAVAAKAGETVSIPLHARQTSPEKTNKLSLSVNRATTHFKCSIGAPVNVTLTDGATSVPVNVPASLKPGEYEILISDAWASETRKGLPGPCTQLIRLTVTE